MSMGQRTWVLSVGRHLLLRKEVTRLDAMLAFLQLAASVAGLATAVFGLLREAMAFAKTLMAHQKNDR